MANQEQKLGRTVRAPRSARAETPTEPGRDGEGHLVNGQRPLCYVVLGSQHTGTTSDLGETCKVSGGGFASASCAAAATDLLREKTSWSIYSYRRCHDGHKFGIGSLPLSGEGRSWEGNTHG